MEETKQKKNEIIALILNIILVILGITGLVKTITGMGYPAWEYYTQLSNYFALCSALIYLVFLNCFSRLSSHDLSPCGGIKHSKQYL